MHHFVIIKHVEMGNVCVRFLSLIVDSNLVAMFGGRICSPHQVGWRACSMSVTVATAEVGKFVHISMSA